MSRASCSSRARRLHRVLGRPCYPAFRGRFFDARFALRSTTRRPSAPSLRRRARAIALRSFPCSFAIAARIARTSSTMGSRHMNYASISSSGVQLIGPCKPADRQAPTICHGRRHLQCECNPPQPPHGRLTSPLTDIASGDKVCEFKVACTSAEMRQLVSRANDAADTVTGGSSDPRLAAYAKGSERKPISGAHRGPRRARLRGGVASVGRGTAT